MLRLFRFFFFFSILLNFVKTDAQKNTKWHMVSSLEDIQQFQFKVTTLNNDFALIKSSSSLIENPNVSLLSVVKGFDLSGANINFLVEHYSDIGGMSDIEILGIRRSNEEDLSPFFQQKNDGENYELIDVVEDFLEFNETYVIEVKRTFQTDFDPNIPLKRIGFIWDTVPLMLGLGGVLLSTNLRNESDANYSAYENQWLAGGAQEAADDFFETAENKRIDANRVLIGSLVTAAAMEGVLWLLFRRKRNKRIKLQEQIWESTGYKPNSDVGMKWKMEPLLFDNGLSGMGLGIVGRF